VASGPAGATLQGAMNVQPIFHATQSGEYTLEVTVRDASTPPCMKIDSLTVSVYGMAVDAGENLSLGVGETSEPLAPTVSGGVGEISHEWRIETSSPSTAITQFGGGGATAPNPTFTPELPGRYTLRLTAVDSNDPEACEVSDAIVVDSVLLTISRPADFAMCVGGESAPLAVAITSPGVPPYVYEWTIEKDSPDLSQDQFGTGGASASSPTFSPNAIGQYALRVTVRDSSVPPAVVSETIDVSAGGMQVSLATELSNCAGAGGMELPRPEVSGGVEPVTYLWTIEPGAPSDEPTQFTDESAFDAAWRFTPSSPGSYTLRLTTTDSATPACVRDSLLVVRAAAISIDAGEDFVTQAFEPSQRLGALPVLAGGGPDATYRWRILTGPDTDSDQLSSTREPRPLFTPKDVGTYALEVTGSDGECSVSDVVVVDAITASQTLEANSEGRVFMSLRIDEPHTAAEIRAAQAAPGTTFMGELTEDGGSGDVAGLLDGTIIGRRVSVTSEAGDGAFVMVVALLYDAGEVASVGDARVRIHAWAADDGLWRPATGGKLEGGAYPPRPTAADVGRSGALAMPAVGPEVYLAWAVVDSAGAFTAGLSKDIEPWSPDPGAADETPSNTPPIGAAGGMCGTVSAPMMLLGLIGPLWLRRRTGGDLRRFD
ncbi:MAG TPA: hypothetical protein VNT79_09405, partial [Phycisphaerae bacterium]|nr:hypothetical protein [Phycisphaerae bacterium]